MSTVLHEAAAAATVALGEHHCAACALEALSGDEDALEVIAKAADSVVDTRDEAGRRLGRRDSAALGFSFGVLVGRALAIRAGLDEEEPS